MKKIDFLFNFYKTFSSLHLTFMLLHFVTFHENPR